MAPFIHSTIFGAAIFLRSPLESVTNAFDVYNNRVDSSNLISAKKRNHIAEQRSKTLYLKEKFAFPFLICALNRPDRSNALHST